MARMKSCSVPAVQKAQSLGVGVFAKYAVRNRFSNDEEFDVWNPPHLVRHHTTYIPASVCGMVMPNDLLSAITSNVLHINRKDVRPRMIQATELEYWTRTHKCHICTDHERENKLCVVCTTFDVQVLEQTLGFVGKYHVLGSIDVDSLETKTGIDNLIVRVTESAAKPKVVLALGQDEKSMPVIEQITARLAEVNVTPSVFDQHVRQGDSEPENDQMAPCESCGMLTAAIKRLHDPDSAAIHWCDDTRLEVRVHDSFIVPNDKFDEWCQGFDAQPDENLHPDVKQAIKARELDVYEIPFTHAGYVPDESGWRFRWCDNVERIFREMRSGSLSTDKESYSQWEDASRSFYGFCGCRDPLQGKLSLSWFFFGQHVSKQDLARGRRGWIIFIQIGNVQALCAAYMAEQLDGTFDAFLRRWGLIIPNMCFAKEDAREKDLRKQQKREIKRQRRLATKTEGQDQPAEAADEQPADEDVDTNEGVQEPPTEDSRNSEDLSYEATFGTPPATPEPEPVPSN